MIGLFDSIMRGYPIGGLLSWRVEPETVKRFRFYGFLREYNEFDNRHNPTLDIAPGQAVTAILDGQQRLTSLNVGLRGSYAYKNPRAWSSFPENYPERRLYLNVQGEADENEAGLRYDFRFLTDAQLKSAAPEECRHWFPVRTVFDCERMAQLWAAAAKADLANNETATDLLSRLWEAVHSTQALHYYEETDQDVERVLDIFIRVNSAGTVSVLQRSAAVYCDSAVARTGRAQRDSRTGRRAQLDWNGLQLQSGHGTQIRARAGRYQRHRVQGQELHRREHGDTR